MADEAMSRATDGARAPFALVCTDCEAAIDAPDRGFFLGPTALVPQANHLLVSVRCLTCRADHDVALWTVDQRWFISEGGLGMVEASAGADAAALVERHHALVAACRREVDAQYEICEGPVELDLSTVDVTIEPDRFAALLPMTTLAAARGLRHAVAERPGMQPPAVVLLGPYGCIVSFDETAGRPYPYALHVSIGIAALPGCLPTLDLNWLLSLFFIHEQVPFRDYVRRVLNGDEGQVLALFADKAFLISVDGRPVDGGDSSVPVTPGSRVVFYRRQRAMLDVLNRAVVRRICLN